MGVKLGKRVRYRVKPRRDANPGASFVEGQFYKSSSQNGPWTKSPSTATTALYAEPYIEGKITTDFVHPGPPYKIGGPLTIVIDSRPDESLLQGIGDYNSGTAKDILGYRRYIGGFGRPSWPAYTTDTVLPDLTSWSLLVFNKLKPKIEKGSLGVALAEVRDLPHMLKSTSRSFHEIWKGMGGHASPSLRTFRRNPVGAYLSMSPKKRADEFLNVQFGWIPFLKDVGDVIDVYNNHSQYLQQISDANNVWQHRKKTLLIQETPEQVIQSGNTLAVSPVLDIMCDVLGGKRYYWTLSKASYTRIWCTGWFKFYSPMFDPAVPGYDSNWNKVQQTLALLGARVNPSVLWKATPWSWLSDWFNSAGIVIDNLAAAGQDGVVSKDLCLMHHRTQIYSLDVTVNFKSNGPRTFRYVRKYETKQRDVAINPYGFGLLPNQLTGMQYAILAALGLGRTRG